VFDGFNLIDMAGPLSNATPAMTEPRTPPVR